MTGKAKHTIQRAARFLESGLAVALQNGKPFNPFKHFRGRTADVFLMILLSVAAAAQGYCQDNNVAFSRCTPIKPSPHSPNQKLTAELPSQEKNVPPILETKLGYFFFTDARLRKIYDHEGLDVQASVSWPLMKWLQIYGSAEFLKKKGLSLNGDEKTTIWEIPLSLGLKPVIRICAEMRYYFTLGPRYVFMHQHNISSYADKVAEDSAIGGFANTGFLFFPKPHLVFDLFGEYSFVWMRVHPSHAHLVYRRTVQAGGLVFGAGLGYSF